MTAEPRQEAEYIVNRVVGIGAMGALGMHVVRDEAGERPSEFADRVKDVLAAAKRTETWHGVYEDMRMDDLTTDFDENEAFENLRTALSGLSEALSALREDG